MSTAGDNRYVAAGVPNGTERLVRSESHEEPMLHRRADRRVTRTRRMLKDALVALILEKGYGALTVQEILDRADVGRATFYAHYRDKEALLLSVFAELRNALRDEFMGISAEDMARFGEGIGLTLPLFAHAAQQRRLYRTLLGSPDGVVLLRYLRNVLATPLEAHLRAAAETGDGIAPARAPVMVAAYVSAVLGVLVWWLEADAPYTPEEMDRMVERLLAPGMASVLHDLPVTGIFHQGRSHPSPCNPPIEVIRDPRWPAAT